MDRTSSCCSSGRRGRMIPRPAQPENPPRRLAPNRPKRPRPRLRRIWHVDKDAAVEIVNELLREYRALPQLRKHDEWDYHIHATSPDQPLADRMAVEAAMAIVDVIRGGELERLRICAADDCDDVLVDLSKNRSRRFCDSGCGNRTNVAAYRARRAGQATT